MSKRTAQKKEAEIDVLRKMSRKAKRADEMAKDGAMLHGAGGMGRLRQPQTQPQKINIYIYTYIFRGHNSGSYEASHGVVCSGEHIPLYDVRTDH